jgi:fructose-1,6-bisphosphatase
MMMNSTKPVRKPDITVKEIGDETFLYSAAEEAIHILNPTAQLIWELCDGEHTVADIEQAIRENFSVPDKHNVAADIQQTLDVFAEKALLQHPA